MVNEQRLSFDIVHIIETLGPGDYHTGRRLFEDLEPITSTATPQVTTHFSPVRSRAEFLELLRSIAEDARLHSHSPILHIEAHGSASGIQVSSDECLTWTEFKAELTTINEISRLNLLVILAVCGGANMVSIIQPVDRVPVRTLIGPNRIVSAGEIERASLAFYRTLFDAGEVRSAWRATHDAVVPDQLTFAVFTAEHMLRYVMHHYLKTLCSEEALARREDDVTASALGNGLPIEKVEHFREWFRSYARDHQGHFERLKQHFFLCDLYPENVTRFDVPFEDCLEIR
jgi:hypothetical protein